jgi:uncharacterized protein YbjT (DUF2867 family)
MLAGTQGSCILIIGGTRSTGRHAAELLRDRGSRVRILARNPEAALQNLGPGFEIVQGDLTKPASLPAAFDGVDHVIFTAGVRSGRFERSSVTRATEYEGVLHTLAAARARNFHGRIVYMTSIGIRRSSLFASGLNIWKGGTFRWRRLAEESIRASGFDYAIVRAAFLLNRPPGQRQIAVRQLESPLTFTETIARADVAEGLVEALHHPRASRATFEIKWTKGPRTASWRELLDALVPDHSDSLAKSSGTDVASGRLGVPR